MHIPMLEWGTYHKPKSGELIKCELKKPNAWKSQTQDRFFLLDLYQGCPSVVVTYKSCCQNIRTVFGRKAHHVRLLPFFHRNGELVNLINALDIWNDAYKLRIRPLKQGKKDNIMTVHYSCPSCANDK